MNEEKKRMLFYLLLFVLAMLAIWLMRPEDNPPQTFQNVWVRPQ